MSGLPFSILQEIRDFIFNSDYKEKLIIKSNVLTPCICLCYFIGVSYIGPQLMKNRRPYSLKYWIMLHNFMLVFLNLRVATGFIKSATILYNDTTFCPSNPELYATFSLELLRPFTWLFFMIKHLELMDSVFFVLRKRSDLLTVLHRYHHALTPIVSLYFARNLVSVCFFLMITLNSSIHVIMYFYYGLAILGPSFQKYLWWKKYITIFQIGQLACVVYCICRNIWTGCYPSSAPEIVLLAMSSAFLILFLNYYICKHMKSKKKLK